jgi:hypothetical protein
MDISGTRLKESREEEAKGEIGEATESGVGAKAEGKDEYEDFIEEQSC